MPMGSLQDKNPLSKGELQKVYGDPGTESYGGFFQEEPNAQWRDEQRVDNVETMRRTDGTVKGVLNALKAPILSTQWKIESPDDSPKGIEIKTKCEDITFNMQGRTFLDFLREALTFLDFGFSAFELIWGIKDGKLTIIDVEPRIQHSVFNWEIADRQPGITQLILNDKIVNTTAEIPMEKLLVFTNDKEGDDFTGQSMLRAAWKHFYAKDKLYRIGLIASERHGVGVPMIKLPGNTGEQEQTEAKEILKNYRANEGNYVILPNKDWEMQILSLTGNSQSGIIEQQIEHHDKMILRTALMGFIGLASGDGGSYSLSEDQSSYALKVVEDKARYLAEQYTRQVLCRFIFMAYPEDYERLKAERLFPYLNFNPLGDVDYQEYANVISTLKNAGLVHVNPEMKQFVHSFFKLPEISENDMEYMREKEEEKEEIIEPENPGEKHIPSQPNEKGDEKEKIKLPEYEEEVEAQKMCEERKKAVKLADFKPWRDLSFAEKRVKFATISGFLDQHQERITKTLDDFIFNQESGFLSKLEKLIDNQDIAGITALTLTGIAALKSTLKEEVKNAIEVGKSQAAGEMGVDVPTTPSVQNKISNAQIDQLVSEYEQAIVNEAKAQAMNAIVAGIGSAAAIFGIKQTFESTASSENSSISGNLSGTALNIGRSLVFDANNKDLYALQRSEILDDRTCPICISIDSRIIDNDDPFGNLGQVHDNCRGLWVPILVTDDDLPTIGDIPKSIKSKFETTEGVPSINNFTQLKNPIYTKNSRAADAEKAGKLE